MAHRARRAVHHARRGALFAAKGAKGSAVSVAIGAGSYFATQAVVSRVAFLNTRWWAPPAALAVAGHFLKRKHPNIGTSLLAVAGYVGGLNYAISRNAPATAQGYDYGQAGGPGDAGALMDNAGALELSQGIRTAQSPRMEEGGAMYDDGTAGDVSDAMMLEG